MEKNILADSKEIMMAYKQAKSERSVVETTWEDVVYYTNPRKRGVISNTTPGEKVPTDVYDATAGQSNIILAAGLAGFLTNASQKWFDVNPRNRQFSDNSDEKIWFSDCGDVIYNVLSESNFYEQIHETYLDFGPFGQGVLYEEEDPRDHVRFYSRHPKEMYLIENEREEVDTCFRCFEMTAYSAYKFFGKENVTEEVRKCVEDNKDLTKKFKFLHYVAPRVKRSAGKGDALNKPFMSVWMKEDDDSKVIKEGGYDEFPFFVPRFYKNSCEVYGYGPGHVIFPDIRMLNNMTKTYYESAEVSLFPPSIMEHDSIIGSLDYRARALNYQKQPLSRGKAVEPLLNGANFQIGLDFINRVEEKIKTAFFVDLFLALRQTKRMTATEVLEISQERMFMLGPVLGRLQKQLLTPMITRTFNILLRRGVLPTPPPSLQGVVDFDVVYTSPLARAQRAMQARDMDAFLMEINNIAAVIPEVRDNIDADEIAKELHAMRSISPRVIRDREVVQQLREQRAQQIAQQQQMAALQQGAQIAKDTGSATKGFADAGRE